MKVFIIFSICIAAVMCRKRIGEDSSRFKDEDEVGLVGGRPAKDNKANKYLEFPWMVSLHFRGNYRCSSFLVTTKFVMTAAHCVVSDNVRNDPKDFIAYMGTVNRDGPDNKVNFTDIIVHEKFDLYKAPDYDIAIMKLADPVELRYNIKPICLPTNGSVYEDTTAQAMGWGQTSNSHTAEILQTTTEKVPTNSKCNTAFEKLYGKGAVIITPRHVCAGGDRRKGICFGDSGGPLVVMNGNTSVAIGITSFISDRGCGADGLPAVYTATAMFTDWIVENMGEDANELCFIDKTTSR